MSTAGAANVNFWPQTACARAFWGQQEVPAYRALLADTTAWLDPRAGERWLDLGCGCGQLTKALWEKSGGTLAQITALDCAAANAEALEKLRGKLQPPLPVQRLRFVHTDFSSGFEGWANDSFDGVVSGLSVQYAEYFSPEEGAWTTEAYDRLMGEVYRVLREGGRFVFSVNVPEPSWGRIALLSLPSMFRSRKPGRYLKNALRMWRYGFWLKREARRGRFHYLPAGDIVDKLEHAGFSAIEHRLSYARQAFLFRCRKTD